MAGVSNIDRFIIFLCIVVSIGALSNVIYLDYFAEEEETITDGTNFTYFTAAFALSFLNQKPIRK